MILHLCLSKCRPFIAMVHPSTRPVASRYSSSCYPLIWYDFKCMKTTFPVSLAAVVLLKCSQAESSCRMALTRAHLDLWSRSHLQTRAQKFKEARSGQRLSFIPPRQVEGGGWRWPWRAGGAGHR